MPTPTIHTADAASALDTLLRDLAPAGVYVLADSNTMPLAARPIMARCGALAGATSIEIGAGDMNKNLATLESVWTRLTQTGATRRSVMVNIGGGMVTDLGGFAAATFKRGMRCINVPTTLLGAVDAALGGKTGINFGGLKNEIGAFAPPCAVVVSTPLFATLAPVEVLSGYAELLKHSLLDGRRSVAEALDFDPRNPDWDRLRPMLRESMEVKQRIVAEDPFEHGLRKALNLGHTAGHAYESLAMEKGRPVPHGMAVAWGLVTALVLSRMKLGFDSALTACVAEFVADNYPRPDFSCDDYPRLLELMHHDKKNPTPDRISLTLLREAGDAAIDSAATDSEIEAAIDITRDLLKI